MRDIDFSVGVTEYFSQLTFQMNKTFQTWAKSLKLPYPNKTLQLDIHLTQHGLSSHN